MFTPKKVSPKSTSLVSSTNIKSALAVFAGSSLIVAGFSVVPKQSDASDPVAMTIEEKHSATPQEIADILAGPGVLFSNVKINGSATPSPDEKIAFGAFSSGMDSVGIESGLVIGANQRASYFSTTVNQEPQFSKPISRTFLASSTPGTIGQTLFDLASNAQLTAGVANVNNVTELEFTVTPTNDFLKFEYVLAITESVDAAKIYPDGIALLSRSAGGTTWSRQNNCASVPTTSTYVAMETTGIVTSGDTRANALANLQTLVAPSLVAGYVPNPLLRVSETPGENVIAPPNIGYAKTLGPIKSMTVPLTCVIDVSAQKATNTPVEIAIAIADFNDEAVPPAVFIQGNSFRFSSSVAPVSAALTNETPGDNTQQQSGPSAPAPSRALTPQPSVPQGVTPGSSAVVLDNGGEAHTLSSNIEDGSLTIEGEGWSASIGATRPAGKSASVSAPNGDLRVPLSGNLSFNLSGYEPSSQVFVYAMPSGKVVASLTVNKKGVVDYDNVKLPKNLSLSNKFLQINGLSEAGLVRSITINAAMFKRSKVVLDDSDTLDKPAKDSIREILKQARGEKVVRCVAYADMTSEEDVAAKTLKAQEFCDFVAKQDPNLVTKVVVREPFKKKMDNRVALRLRG